MSIEEITRYVNISLRVLFAIITACLVFMALDAVLQIADANERIATQLEQQSDPFAWENL